MNTPDSVDSVQSVGEVVGISKWFTLIDDYRKEWDCIDREVLPNGQSIEQRLAEPFVRLIEAVAQAVYESPDGREKAIAEMEKMAKQFGRVLDLEVFVTQVNFQLAVWDEGDRESAEFELVTRTHGTGLLNTLQERTNAVLLNGSHVDC